MQISAKLWNPTLQLMVKLSQLQSILKFLYSFSKLYKRVHMAHSPSHCQYPSCLHVRSEAIGDNLVVKMHFIMAHAQVQFHSQY